MPIILTNIGRSDHKVVVMTPKHQSSHRGDDVMVTVQSRDANSRVLMGRAIADID